MPEFRKTLLTLPEEVVSAFERLATTPAKRDSYIRALRANGWTLQSIAKASDVTRERIRQITSAASAEEEDVSKLPLPTPPLKEEKVAPVYTEPDPELLARLLELQPMAQRVRSRSPEFRKEAEEYTALIWKAHSEDGVTLYRLAKRLGVSHGALRFRLARYGYKVPDKGTSRVYAPIKDENRIKD